MNRPKRQDLPTPAGLKIVATPIGNLADLSPRALQCLSESQTVLCEDTRRTRTLFTALQLEARQLVRFDAHSSGAQVEALIERMREGESMALVTDAGTPAVSDPAALLVSRCGEEGIPVSPVPGPSAVTALLSVAGFSDGAFTFHGFFPRKDRDRNEVLVQAEESPFSRIHLWFESPERMTASIELIAERLPLCQLVVAKELTKVYEHVFYGRAEQVYPQVRDEIQLQGARGEWCFCLQIPFKEQVKKSDWEIAAHLLLEARVAPSEVSKKVSEAFGVSKKQVYDFTLKSIQKKV